MTTTPDAAGGVSDPRRTIGLLDSNVLIYATQGEAPQHEAAKAIRDRALTGALGACITPQVLNEFFAVVSNTRRPRVSAPLTVQEAGEEIRRYTESKELATILPGEAVVERLLSLLESHPVSGQDIHDLYLAATMLESGVTTIYTFNTADFASIPGIEAVDPTTVSAQ